MLMDYYLYVAAAFSFAMGAPFFLLEGTVPLSEYRLTQQAVRDLEGSPHGRVAVRVYMSHTMPQRYASCVACCV